MTDDLEKQSPDKKTNNGFGIRAIGAVAIVVGILLAFFTFWLASRITDVAEQARAEEMRYVACEDAVNQLMDASDYLTEQVRMFVATSRTTYLDNYLNELEVVDRRGKALESLRENSPEDTSAVTELQHALEASNDLANDELIAMRLTCDYYQFNNIPEKIANIDTSTVEPGLSREGKLELARYLVLGTGYDEAKQMVKDQVQASSDSLLSLLNENMEEREKLTQSLLFQLRISVALLLCVVMVLVLVLFMYVLKPLDRYMKRVEHNEPLEAEGAYELQYLANAYNTMYEDNNKRIEQLREVSERDPLTGISNREGYDNFLATHTRNVALILFDVDHLKEFNAAYGRETGDAVLAKLGAALSTVFRSTDYPCRVESDRFAVVMTNMSDDMHDAVVNKVDLVKSLMADDSDDLPFITFSTGAAFSGKETNVQDIQRAAEAALKQAQDNHSRAVMFYSES